MNVAFLTDWPLENPQLRSGVPYNIARGLTNNQIPYKEIYLPPQRGSFLAKLKSKTYQIWFNKIRKQKEGLWDANFEPFKAKATAKIVNQEINKERPDALFSIKVADFAYLKPEIPRFIWIDNTYDTYDTYISTPHQPAIPQKLYDKIVATEKQSMQKCTKIFTASNWLKEHLCENYKIPDKKIEIIERGASFFGFKNFEEFRKNQDIKNYDHCHLLFIGTNWNRKGGEKIVATCQKLKENNFPFTLHMVGVEPPSNVWNELENNFKYHGKLYQNNPTESQKLRYLFSNSHFLFVPTLADGFGIVYAEAASFGLPSIATDTMGVKSSVINNVTGHRFPLNTSNKVYAQHIQDWFHNKKAHNKLAQKTHKYALENFDWDKNVNRMIKSIKENM